jgi:hypothetical protein
VRAILEHFHCVNGNTAEDWSLMTSLAATSAIVNLQFPRIIAWACSTYYSFVDVDGRPYLSAPTTLVQLLLNTSIHSYTLHCGKQFCLYLAANCWCFIPSDTKKCTTACCLSLVQTSSGTVILHHANMAQTDCNWTTLTWCHCLTLSFSMTRPQQCCQSYNENIPILPYFLNILHISISTILNFINLWFQLAALYRWQHLNRNRQQKFISELVLWMYVG